MSDKHDVTKKLRSLIAQRAEEEGLGNQPNLSVLQDQMCGELDDWMDQAPAFVSNMQVRDKSNGSML